MVSPDVLPWEEIKKRYPDEWIVLVDCQLDAHETVVGGRVLAHSPRKRDLREALTGPRDAAFLFTGRPRPIAAAMVRFDGEV